MDRRSFLGISVAACGIVLLSPALEGVPLLAETGNVLDATWIGHSTVLLRFPGLNVLTDPVLFDKVGVNVLGSTIGISRYTRPAILPHELPRIDVVLLSHAHMDHTDIQSLEFLTERNPEGTMCICAKNTSDVIEGMKWKSVTELDWGEGVKINGISVSAFEVLHNGWRYPWEGCRRNGQRKTGRSYNGYVLDYDGMRTVFGGDTAHKDGFGPGGKVDISIMPIGAYEGYLDNHCTPEGCMDMVKQMSSKVILPVHFGTFVQSDEPRDEPMKRLLKSSSDVLVAGHHPGYSFKI
jgi:L-ascorbate metabolism protein UlaG (beta-lactamase superfamily)